MSQLDLGKMEQESWPAKADRAMTGSELSIAGQQFKRGIGSHANSTLRVHLSGTGGRFTASVGVDDFRPPASATPPARSREEMAARVSISRGRARRRSSFLA